MTRLVDARQRMKDIHVFLGAAQELLGQNIEILESYVIFFVEEALSLDACHIEQVKLGDHVFKFDAFLIGISLFVEELDDIVGHLQFRRGDENKVDAFISGHCLDQGMDGHL